MTEEWRPVAGSEGLYEVSSEGRVRSLPRLVAGGNGSRAIRGGSILKPSVTGYYAHVSLSHGSTRSNARVHVMVAKAFLGPRPSGLNACHRNGNSRDNRAVNLYWGTQVENIRDKKAHGTAFFALRRGHCKHGHEYNEQNTYMSATGSPVCRTCRRIGMRKGRVSA